MLAIGMGDSHPLACVNTEEPTSGATAVDEAEHASGYEHIVLSDQDKELARANILKVQDFILSTQNQIFRLEQLGLAGAAAVAAFALVNSGDITDVGQRIMIAGLPLVLLFVVAGRLIALHVLLNDLMHIGEETHRRMFPNVPSARTIQDGERGQDRYGRSVTRMKLSSTVAWAVAVIAAAAFGWIYVPVNQLGSL